MARGKPKKKRSKITTKSKVTRKKIPIVKKKPKPIRRKSPKKSRKRKARENLLNQDYLLFLGLPTKVRRGISKKERNQLIKSVKAFAEIRDTVHKKFLDNDEQFAIYKKASEDFKRGFVHAVDREFLRVNETIAVYPSRARWHKHAQKMYDALVEAELAGHLDHTALEIADEYDLPVQEVYTLFFSP